MNCSKGNDSSILASSIGSPGKHFSAAVGRGVTTKLTNVSLRSESRKLFKATTPQPFLTTKRKQSRGLVNDTNLFNHGGCKRSRYKDISTATNNDIANDSGMMIMPDVTQSSSWCLEPTNSDKFCTNCNAAANYVSVFSRKGTTMEYLYHRMEEDFEGGRDSLDERDEAEDEKVMLFENL